MKQKKYEALLEDVGFFLADRFRASFHRVFFEDVCEAFPDAKRKHLKKVWKELS